MSRRVEPRTALVTGATDRIGREAALGLAKKAWKVYVHGRSETKVASVVAALRSDVPSGSVEGVVSDFADRASVRALAEQVSGSRLDALVNNVGIGAFHGERSADGHELTFAVVTSLRSRRPRASCRRCSVRRERSSFTCLRGSRSSTPG